ncbi:MAG TPA: dihydropteroate synthase, partial [Gemmatimonadales bacterium]|nr:dihydropteroate synthase [Gemmatimonadales bacterium]
TLESLRRHAGHRLGLELLTGPDWAIVAGSRARLSALARPWGGPPELAEVAMAVGLALPADLPVAWLTARGPVPLERPVLLAILNVTPDSFSDGGRWDDAAAALVRAEALLEAGAGMLDVGGESTRPGRPEPVPAAEERRRVVPVVEAIVRRFPEAMVSVDTVKAEVARAALEAGAAVVNDVSGGRLDPGLAPAVAAAGAGFIAMHSRGSTATMATYDQSGYGTDLTGTVTAELRAALDAATAAGIEPDRVVLDPGLGFSKTPAQSLRLLDQLGALRALGRPILVGPSRKRFLGEATGREVGDRDRATAAACLLAWERGARLFRVHEPAAVSDALALAAALEGTA